MASNIFNPDIKMMPEASRCVRLSFEQMGDEDLTDLSSDIEMLLVRREGYREGKDICGVILERTRVNTTLWNKVKQLAVHRDYDGLMKIADSSHIDEETDHRYIANFLRAIYPEDYVAINDADSLLHGFIIAMHDSISSTLDESMDTHPTEIAWRLDSQNPFLILEFIAEGVLSGNEWSSETSWAIADILRASGYQIDPPDEAASS